jgi:hypothetical protein
LQASAKPLPFIAADGDDADGLPRDSAAIRLSVHACTKVEGLKSV